MTQWFYEHRGERMGPVSQEELEHKLQSEEVSGDSLVWRDGMAEWAVARQLPELSNKDNATPPPLARTTKTDALLWLLVFSSLINLMAQYALLPLTSGALEKLALSFIVPGAIALALVMVDRRSLKKAGHTPPNVFWFLVLPAYIYLRQKKLGNSKWLMLGLYLATAILAAIIGYQSGLTRVPLPSCDSSDTKTTVQKIVDGLPVMQQIGAQFITLTNISEQGYNPDTQLRSCTATLVTTVGEDVIQYSIRWDDEQQQRFLVEAQIL